MDVETSALIRAISARYSWIYKSSLMHNRNVFMLFSGIIRWHYCRCSCKLLRGSACRETIKNTSASWSRYVIHNLCFLAAVFDRDMNTEVIYIIHWQYVYRNHLFGILWNTDYWPVDLLLLGVSYQCHHLVLCTMWRLVYLIMDISDRKCSTANCSDKNLELSERL